MNQKEHIPNILNDVYNERKESIIQTFQSIFEKILNNINLNNNIHSFQEIEKNISTTMTKLFLSEQERFLSYLIFNISHIAKLSHLKDPNLVKQYYIKMKKFDEKYDGDKQLQLLFQTFRSKQVQSSFPDFVSFFTLFLGFSFDTTIIRSTLFELREIINNTMKTVSGILKISRTKVCEIIKNSSLIENKKYENLGRKASIIQIQHEKEINSYQTTLNNYNAQIKKYKQNETEMKQFRLNLEGDLIQIIGLIESLEKKDLNISQPHLIINEIKKKSSQLLSKIKLTISPESTNTTINKTNDESYNLELLQQLNEKDIIISDLNNQLQNTLYLLNESDNNNNNSLPLIKPNKVNSIDPASKISEVIKKTSIDLQNALNEKQELRKKLAQFQDLQSKFDSLEKEKNKLKEKLDESNFLKEKYHEKNQLLKQQIKDNEVKFNSLIQKVTKLQKKVDQQKTRIKTAEKPLTETDFDSFKSSLLIEEIREKTNSIVEYENMLTQLQKENLNLLNENESLRNSRKIEEMKVKQLKENLKDLNNQLDQRDEQYRELRSSLTSSNVAEIEEQLKFSLNENQNLILKFNKFIKKYQDLKNNTQNIITDNEQLKQQVDVLKSQIDEYSKSDKNHLEKISNLTNEIELMKKEIISNDEIKLIFQKYNVTFHQKNSVIEIFEDLVSNLDKNDKEIKEKSNHLLNLESKTNQYQQLTQKLQQENQNLSNYLKEIQSILKSQNNQNLLELIKQTNLESEQMKSILNYLKNQTKSENDQKLIQKITNLIVESNFFYEIKKITNSKDNQDAKNRIITLLRNNEILNNIKSMFKQDSNENIIEIISKIIQDSLQFHEVKQKLMKNSDCSLSERINALLHDSFELNSIKPKLLLNSSDNLEQKIDKMIQESEELKKVKSKLLKNIKSNKNFNEVVDKLIEGNEELKEIKRKLKIKETHENDQNLSEKIDELISNTNELERIKNEEQNKINNEKQELEEEQEHEEEQEQKQKREDEETIATMNQVKAILNQESSTSIIENIQNLLQDSNELKSIKPKLLQSSNSNDELMQIVDNLIQENEEFKEIKIKLTPNNNSDSNLAQIVDELLQNNSKFNEIKQRLSGNSNDDQDLIQIICNLLHEKQEFKEIELKLTQNSNKNSKLSQIVDSLFQECRQFNEIKQKLTQNSSENTNLSQIVDSLFQECRQFNEIKQKLTQDSNENTNLSQIVDELIQSNIKFKEINQKLTQDLSNNTILSQNKDELSQESNKPRDIDFNSNHSSNTKDNYSQTIEQYSQYETELETIKSKIMKNNQISLSARIENLLDHENELDNIKSKLLLNSNDNLEQKIDKMIQESEELKKVKSKLLKNIKSNKNFNEVVDELIEGNEELKEIKRKLKIKETHENDQNLSEKIDELLSNTNELERIKNEEQNKINNEKRKQKEEQEQKQKQERENEETIATLNQIKTILNQESSTSIIESIQNLLQDSNDLKQIKVKLPIEIESTTLTMIDKLNRNTKILEQIKAKLKLNSNEEILQTIIDLIHDQIKLTQLKAKLLQDSKESVSMRIASLIRDSNKLKEVKSCILQNPGESFSKRIKTLLNESNELKQIKSTILQDSTESFSKRLSSLLKESNELAETKSKILQDSDESFPKRIETLLNESNELKKIKSKILQNSNESFNTRITNLLKESSELKEIKSKILQNSNESFNTRITNLLNESSELKEIKSKLIRNSNENLSQRILQLLQESQELDEIKSKLLHGSNENLSQKLDDLIQQSIELKDAKLKAFQNSNSKSNLSIKINELIQENNELTEMKLKLIQDSNENLSQIIDHLLKNNSEFNRIAIKLKQNSNSNDLNQIIDSFIQNKKELNEAKSKLTQFLGPNQAFIQKVNFLLQTDQEFKEMRSKIIQNSNETLPQRIDHLLKDNFNYNKLVAILRQNSNFQDPFQIIDGLIQNTNELNEVKLKFMHFSNPNESLIQKVNNLLQNDKEFKEMKSQIIQDSGEILSQKIDSLLKDNYDFNRILSRLNKNSNLQDPFQIIDQLVQNNSELNEAKSKLIHFSNTNENFLQKVDNLLRNNNELNEIRSKLINFSNPKENLIQKIDHLLQNDRELKQTKSKLIQETGENLSQKVDRLIKDSFEYNRLLTQLKQNSNSNSIDTFQVIDEFVQNNNELNEIKSILNQFSDSNESLIDKINILIKNDKELNEINDLLNQFSDSDESLFDKINNLLQNNKELCEAKSKLNQFSNSNDNSVQKINILLQSNKELNKIKSILSQFSNSNENLDQKVNKLIKESKELNEVKSKLSQFSKSTENIMAKIEILLQNDKELNEAKSNLIQFSESDQSIIQTINDLLENLNELNEIKSKLNQFSDSDQKSIQKVNNLLQINKELIQIKSKLNQFTDSKDSPIQKIEILIQNNDELKSMKSKLPRNSSSTFSEEMSSMIQKVDELEKAKSKLNCNSNEKLIQEIEKLLNENKKLKEIQSKFGTSYSELTQKVDDLIENEKIMNNLKEVLNVNSTDEIIENFKKLNEITELFKCTNLKQLPKICSKMIEKMNQASSIMNSDINEFPDNILELKEKSEKMSKLLMTLNEFIPFNTNKELIEKVKENISLISEINDLIPFNNYKQLISSLKSSVNFERAIEQFFQVDNKKDAIQRLKEQAKENHKIYKNLQSIFPSEEFKHIIPRIKEELNNYQIFINKIQKIIPFENDEDLIQKINQLIEEIEFSKKKELHHKKVINSFKSSFQNSDISIQNLSQQITDIENNHSVFLNELAKKMKINKEKVSENKILQKTYLLQELADLIHNALPEVKNPINALNRIFDKLHKDDSIFEEIRKIIKCDKIGNLPSLIKQKENQIKILIDVANQLSLSSFEEIPESIEKLRRKVNEFKYSSNLTNDQQQYLKSTLINVLHLSQKSSSDDSIINKVSSTFDIMNSIMQILDVDDIDNLPLVIKRLQQQQEKLQQQQQPLEKLQQQQDEKLNKSLDISQFEEVFSQLKSLSGSSIQQNELDETIRQMKNENILLSNLINELQNSIRFDRSNDMSSYIKGLIEQHPNESPQLENLLKHLHSLKKLDTILIEIQKLKDNFTSKTDELKQRHQSFVDSITKIIDGSNQIEDEIEIPSAIMTINNEKNELQKKNETNLELIGNLKQLINFHDDQDLFNKIENLLKLKKRVQRIKENINGINDIDELPQFIDNIQNELQNATKKYSSIVKQLSSLTGEKSEIKLVSEIAKQIDELKQLEEDIKRISSSKNLKEAFSKIKEAINDKKVLEDLSNSLSMEIDYIPSELIKLQNQTNSLKSQISNLQENLDSKSSELNRVKENHSNFISTLLSSLEINGKENEIVKNIVELKSKNESLKKWNSSMKSKIVNLLKIDDFSEFPDKVSDLIQEKNDLQNELNNLNEQIRCLQESFHCDDISQIQEIFDALKKSKEKAKDLHSKFVSQISSALQTQQSSPPRHFTIQSESQLIESITKLRKNNLELVDKIKQNEKNVSSLKEVLKFNDLHDLQSAIQELTSENEILMKVSRILNCDPKEVFQSIENIIKSLKNQKKFIEKISENLGISIDSDLNDSNDNLLLDLENQSSDLLKQLETLNNTMKMLECNNIKSIPSKINEIFDEKRIYQQKLEESEKKRNKLQNYLGNLKKSFSEVSNCELNDIPSELANFKRENEKLKKTVFDMDSSFKQFKEQITDGLKMWDTQSADEIVSAINSMKSLKESNQNNHDSLIEKLRFIIKFNNEEQIPSIIEKVVNENRSMSSKLKRLSQIQSSLGDTTIDDIPQTLNQLKSSLKSKNDQIEELNDKYHQLVNGIRSTISFENETEIIPKLNKLSILAKETKDQYDKMTGSIKNALDLQDDSEIVKAVNSLKKKLNKKEENEKSVNNFIKEIQKTSNSQSVSDICSNIAHLHDQIEKYEKIINIIKQLLSVDEDKVVSAIKKLISNNQTNEEQIKHNEEIFENIKKIINFNSPERIPSIIEKMCRDLEKSTNLSSSLSKVLKTNTPDDFTQKISQIKNDLKKMTTEYDNLTNQLSMILDSTQSNDNIIQKVKSLQNNLNEVNELYKELQQKHSNFVELIGRIIKNPDEDSIIEKIQQNTEKLRSLEIMNQNQSKTINSLKQILSVNSDESLIKTVQKLLDSTLKIKSTMSSFNSNYQLPRDGSISELNSHIMSFESDFDSLRTKFEQIKSLFDVSDDDNLYDVLSNQKENYKQLVSQLLSATRVNKEKEIVGFVQQLILDHKSLINELNEATGFEDPKQICLSIKQTKKKLSNAEKIIGKESDNFNSNENNDFVDKIQNLKDTIDELKIVTGTNNEKDLLSNVSSIYSTLRNKRRKSSFIEDTDFNPKMAIEEAENRNRILNELKSVAKSNNIEEVKDNMIQSRKIVNDLKNILGIENEMQIVPQIKDLINSFSSSKKSFKKSSIQQLKDSLNDDKEFIDSFLKEMDTTDKDEGLLNLRKMLKFIENLKKVTEMNNEDEILQNIKNIVQSSDQFDVSDNSENDNENGYKKRRPSMLKLASQKIESFQKLSDKLRTNNGFDNEDDTTDKLLHLSEHVNKLKKITGIDDEDDLFSQIGELIDTNDENSNDLNSSKSMKRRPSLYQMKDSVEQNKKLLNLIQNEAKINDGEKATQKLIQAQKIVNDLKKLTGIENDTQIIPQIKTIMNLIGSSQDGSSISPRNRIEKMKKKIDSNNKISEMVKNLTKTDSNEEASDHLNQWQKIINELRKLTNSKDDSQIIPQIRQVFSLITDKNLSFNSDDDDEDENEYGSFNRSKVQKAKESIERNRDLLNKIKSVSKIGSNLSESESDDEIDESKLLNSISVNKRLADELKKVTGTDDEDKIIRQIRSIFDAASSDASLDSPRVGKRNQKNLSQQQQQQQQPTASTIAENQKLLNDLKKLSNVNDSKQLKQIIEFVNYLKDFIHVDDLFELKEKIMKYSEIINQLLKITGEKDESSLPEQIQNIFNIMNINQNGSASDYEEDENLELGTLSSSEKIQVTIESNKNFVKELMKLFKINNISRLKEIIEQYYILISTLKKNLQLSNDNQINPSVSNMIQTLDNLRSISKVDSNKNIKTVLSRYTNLFNSLSSMMNISSTQESDFLNSMKKLIATEKRYKNIILVLRNHLSYHSEDDIPQVVNETLTQSRIDRNFVSHLFSLIEESDQIDITLDENLSTDIVQWFIKYLREADEVIGEHQKFIASAAVYGYQGNSSIEASNFLIECAITKRKHEIMESAHDEIESLRKTSEAKVKLVEKRNKELSDALERSHKIRKEIQQTCTDIQNKSIEDELTMQNEINELTNTISNYKKSQAELVRLASGKSYDKEILIKFLPKDDQIMLKIM